MAALFSLREWHLSPWESCGEILEPQAQPFRALIASLWAIWWSQLPETHSQPDLHFFQWESLPFKLYSSFPCVLLITISHCLHHYCLHLCCISPSAGLITLPRSLWLFLGVFLFLSTHLPYRVLARPLCLLCACEVPEHWESLMRVSVSGTHG